MVTYSILFRTLVLQTRLNSYGANHNLHTRSPRITGRHIGESPKTSIIGSGLDRVCGDLPAYILVWKNCLEMQTRNSSTKASVQDTDFEALIAKAKVFDELMKEFLSNRDSANSSQTIGSALYNHVETTYTEGFGQDSDNIDLVLEHLSRSALLSRLESLYHAHHPNLLTE